MSEFLREIGSNTAKLRAYLSESKKDLQSISSLLDSLTTIFRDIWESDQFRDLTESPQQWREFLNITTSGKVLGVAAQAEQVLGGGSGNVGGKSWIGDGREYARWLGKGVTLLAGDDPRCDPQPNKLKRASELCGKSFGIGYNGIFRPSTTELGV